VKLATNNGLQDIHLRLSIIGWHRSCVPSWRMYTVTAAGRCPLRSADNRTC